MTQPVIHGAVTPVRSIGPGAELIVLGPSLGTTMSLWELPLPALAENHRVLRFDLPGHGLSPSPADAFTIADLADAVVALVDSIGGGSFHYAGISIGGAIGLELALRHPERIASLTIICSAAKIGTAEGWAERAAQVRASGTASVVAGSASRWFAPDLLEREPAGARALNELLDIDDEGYAKCCEALATFDANDRVGAITARTLCVAGALDGATPAAGLEELGERIPGASAVVIEGAAHLPSIEKPAAVASLVLGNSAAGNTATGSDTSADRHARGMAVRRAVLGDEHVDRAIARTTPETADFQDFITRYAWGEIWSRPGLDRRTRSFLTLASLVTAGHEQEIGMHVRAALTNGLSRAEISEAILHTAVYAGVPAANSAFAIAREVFAELDAVPTNLD